MAKGRDTTPALFLMELGFIMAWYLGWFPAWILVSSMAVLGIFVAFKVKGAIAH